MQTAIREKQIANVEMEHENERARQIYRHNAKHVSKICRPQISIKTL